jgi:tRNA pseudouridine55 synthase
MNGFINLIKPKNMSSAYAVGMVKKKFNLPCGHMGTLDPMASGVLPIGVGKASRLFQYMIEKKKAYKAEFTFGKTTDTLDAEGEVTGETKVIPTLNQLEKAVKSLVGEIMQIPPDFSAKCVNGKRSYQLARQGVKVDLPPKKIKVDKFEVVEQISDKVFTFYIECEGGTYIRALARDLAKEVGSLAYMSKLERTKSGIFEIENAVTFEELKNSENPEKYLISSDKAVSFEKLNLTKEQARKILDGVFLNYGFLDGIYRVYNEGEFFGVGQVVDGILKIKSYVR